MNSVAQKIILYFQRKLQLLCQKTYARNLHNLSLCTKTGHLGSLNMSLIYKKMNAMIRIYHTNIILTDLDEAQELRQTLFNSKTLSMKSAAWGTYLQV